MSGVCFGEALLCATHAPRIKMPGGRRRNNFLNRSVLTSESYAELLGLLGVAGSPLAHKRHWIDTFSKLQSWNAAERRKLVKQLQVDRNLTQDDAFDLSMVEPVAPLGMPLPPAMQRQLEAQHEAAEPAPTVVGVLSSMPASPAPQPAIIMRSFTVVGEHVDPTPEILEDAVEGTTMANVVVTVVSSEALSTGRQRLTASQLTGYWHSDPGPGLFITAGCCSGCLCIVGCCSGCPCVGCYTQRSGPNWQELEMDVCSGDTSQQGCAPRAKLGIISRDKLTCNVAWSMGITSEQVTRCFDLHRV